MSITQHKNPLPPENLCDDKESKKVKPTQHVIIEGWLHRFIATKFGRPVSVFYLGYHCQGYMRGTTMHIDPRSYRQMTESDRPVQKNVVVPFRRKT